MSNEKTDPLDLMWAHPNGYFLDHRVVRDGAQLVQSIEGLDADVWNESVTSNANCATEARKEALQELENGMARLEGRPPTTVYVLPFDKNTLPGDQEDATGMRGFHLSDEAAAQRGMQPGIYVSEEAVNSAHPAEAVQTVIHEGTHEWTLAVEKGTATHPVPGVQQAMTENRPLYPIDPGPDASREEKEEFQKKYIGHPNEAKALSLEMAVIQSVYPELRFQEKGDVYDSAAAWHAEAHYSNMMGLADRCQAARLDDSSGSEASSGGGGAGHPVFGEKNQAVSENVDLSRLMAEQSANMDPVQAAAPGDESLNIEGVGIADQPKPDPKPEAKRQGGVDGSGRKTDEQHRQEQETSANRGKGSQVPGGDVRKLRRQGRVVDAAVETIEDGGVREVAEQGKAAAVEDGGSLAQAGLAGGASEPTASEPTASEPTASEPTASEPPTRKEDAEFFSAIDRFDKKAGMAKNPGLLEGIVDGEDEPNMGGPESGPETEPKKSGAKKPRI